MTELESRGLPAVGIASSEFIEAARRQGEALGFAPAYVFVPHPIQDRTDEEIGKLAEAALDQIVAALTVEAD